MLFPSLLLSVMIPTFPLPLVAAVAPDAHAAAPAAPEKAAPAIAGATVDADAKPPAPSADGKKVVAILDLKTEGGVEALASAMSSVLSSNVAARGYHAVARSELKALLSHLADANLLGCQSVNCAMDVAKLTDASLVLTGSLGKLPSADGTAAYALSLSLIDPAGQAIVGRAEAAWRSAPEEMVTVIPPLLDRLFDGPGAAKYVGALEIVAPDGVTVSVDGKEIGTAPLKGPVRDLAIGVHTIDAAGDGWVPGKKDVAVAHSETVIAKITLEEAPYYTQWWFWTAVGGGTAVAVAAGTTIGVVALLGEPPTRIVVKTALPPTSPSAE